MNQLILSMRLLLTVFIVFACLSFTVNTVEYQLSDKDIWIDARLNSMTLEQKINQSMIVLLDLNWEVDKIQETMEYVRLTQPGGVYIQGGDPEMAKRLILQMHHQSITPYYFATEAFCGLEQSFLTYDRFPSASTLSAADSLELTKRVSELVADDCLSIGINLNLIHSANVYSNPLNTKGYQCSFGENPRTVEAQCDVYVKAVKDKKLAYIVGDFPGAGDLDLQENGSRVCNNPKEHIEAIDLMPFRKMIYSGVEFISMSNGVYPALDSQGVQASESAVIIKDLLREQLGFKGIVSSTYVNGEHSVNAYSAGCDMVLKVESPATLINKIKSKVQSGEIEESEINDKCKRILGQKYDMIVSKKESKQSKFNKEWTIKTVYESALTTVKNNGILPIQRLDQKIALVSIGSHEQPLWNAVSRTAAADMYHAYSIEEAIERYNKLGSQYDLVITSLNIHDPNSTLYAEPWFKELNGTKNIALVAGNARAVRDLDQLSVDALILSYENHPYALDRLGELVMGAVPSTAQIPFTINANLKRGAGVNVPWGGRLSESDPSVLGVSDKKLQEIDEIVLNGIKEKAFPGCQVLVALQGKVIYRKNFGYQTYDSLIPVENNTIYDIASVTKVVSSTASVMRLQSLGDFSLDSTLGSYLGFVDSTAYKRMVIREMMAHQAGLYPWIPFYTKTMSGGVHDSLIYSDHQTKQFSRRVSTNLWIDPSYEGTMYDAIIHTSLGRKKYKYSDLGYYFLKRIIEDKSGLSQDEFVAQNFYRPMGLQTIGYNPLNRFDIKQVPPTEDDKIFRKELVHGYVHDQGTAMLGGVGGHAGIFSNSWDIAAVMQMFLNGGKYGMDFISADVINEYTGCQFCPTNRRGAGFDKPVRSLDGGPTCELVSLDSYGHSGFTGTYVWADPKYDINYVFLSNRVYPDAENWKIVSMNIRSDIQRVIYEAVLNRSDKN